MFLWGCAVIYASRASEDGIGTLMAALGFSLLYIFAAVKAGSGLSQAYRSAYAAIVHLLNAVLFLFFLLVSFSTKSSPSIFAGVLAPALASIFLYAAGRERGAGAVEKPIAPAETMPKDEKAQRIEALQKRAGRAEGLGGYARVCIFLTAGFLAVFGFQRGWQNIPQAYYALAAVVFAACAGLLFFCRNFSKKASVTAALMMLGEDETEAANFASAATDTEVLSRAGQRQEDYRRQHADEVAAFKAAFIGEMTGVYGFRKEYADKFFVSPTGEPLYFAENMHRQKNPPADAAKKIYEEALRSGRAANPEMFERNIRTGKEVSLNIKPSVFKRGLFGSDAPSPLAMACYSFLYLSMFFCFYGMYGNVFIPSKEWSNFVLVLSFGLFLVLCVTWVWFVNRAAYVPPKGKKPHVVLLFFASAMIALMSYISIGQGAASFVNKFIGTETEVVHAVRKDSPTCVFIEEIGRFVVGTKLCMKREDYDALEKMDRVEFQVRQSFFGEELVGYWIPRD